MGSRSCVDLAQDLDRYLDLARQATVNVEPSPKDVLECKNVEHISSLLGSTNEGHLK
jgi:hypothetical protein